MLTSQWSMAVLVLAALLVCTSRASGCPVPNAARCQATVGRGATEILSYVTLDREEAKCVVMQHDQCCPVSRVEATLAVPHVYQPWLCPPELLISRKRNHRLRLNYAEDEQQETFHTMQSTNAIAWHLDRLDGRALPLDGHYDPLPLAGHTTVHVYVVDTGLVPEHAAFNGVTTTLSYPAGTAARDCNGHGTHVSSLIASSTVGVVHESGGRVALHAVRVLDCSGSGTTSDVIAGLAWIANNVQHPAVINLSIGGPTSAILNQFLDAMSRDLGVLIVAAAGNGNTDACERSPSSAQSVIAVAATTSSDTRSSFSNVGPCVSIFAPGSNIRGANFASLTAYTGKSGTSMSSPLVVGAVARLITSTSAQAWQHVLSLATPNRVQGAGANTPNLLLFIGTTATSPPPPPPLTPPPPPSQFQSPPPPRTFPPPLPPPPPLSSQSPQGAPSWCLALVVAIIVYLL